MLADKPTELSRIKLKTWTREPVPMISKHSAHSTSLPVGFRTWLWRYTCLLLLISMLWHRQAIFESKGDKLSSSAEATVLTTHPCVSRCLRVNDFTNDNIKKSPILGSSFWKMHLGLGNDLAPNRIMKIMAKFSRCCICISLGRQALTEPTARCMSVYFYCIT